MQSGKLHVELRSNLDWIPAVAAEGEVAPATGERRPHSKTSPAAVLGSLKASFIYLYISLFPSRRRFLSLSFLFTRSWKTT